jgi:hypothetical protein
VSTYNYAENEPIGHIDLHGLQKAKPEDGKKEWTEQEVFDWIKKYTVTQTEGNANDQQQAEAMMLIFSPENVGVILMLAEGIGGLKKPRKLAGKGTGKRVIGGSIPDFSGVNDIQSNACGPCAIATDRRLGGDITATASKVVDELGIPLERIKESGMKLDEISGAYGKSFDYIGDLKGVYKRMKASGPGSRGIVVGSNKNLKDRHAFNVFVDDTGTVRAFDNARDITRTLKEFGHNVQLLKTN